MTLSFAPKRSSDRTFFSEKVLSDERSGAKLRVTENRCVPFNSLIYVYIYKYILVKESKRTHRFSVTLSFAPKCSSNRTFSEKKVLSDKLSVCLYIYIYIYIYLFIYIYIHI